MPELEVDQYDIGLIAMGLTHIPDHHLTEDGKKARAQLAYRLGVIAGDLLGKQRTGGEAA